MAAPRRSMKASRSSPATITQVYPAWVRYVEIFCAIAIWLATLPVLLSAHDPHHQTLALVLVVVVALLTCHSHLLRPWFMEEELPEDDENDYMMYDIDRSLAKASEEISRRSKARTMRDKIEEYKAVLIIFVLLSAAGSLITFSRGGSKVLKTYSSPSIDHCSMVDLPRLHKESGSSKFHCDDGYVALNKQVSLVTTDRAGYMGPHTYRMAPVFENSDRTGNLLGIAIARDMQLDGKPCDDGICGVMVSLETTDCGTYACVTSADDQKAFTALKDTLEAALKAKGLSGDVHGVPLYDLMDPANPEGKVLHAIVAIVLYGLAFLGLVIASLNHVFEDLNPYTRKESYASIEVSPEESPESFHEMSTTDAD